MWNETESVIEMGIKYIVYIPVALGKQMKIYIFINFYWYGISTHS